MQIVTGSNIFNKQFDKSIVTIGNFDGVHLGHLELFRRLTEESRSLALPSVVVTFEPHPLKVLAPDSAPCLITTFDQKVALIADTGIDCLVVVPFSRELSQMPAAVFVRDILCESLGMRHIIIGHDYAFGHERKGNFDTLERLGNEWGFTLEDLDPVGEGNLVYSSSLARSRIACGDMAAVSSILGRYYMISGTVVHGRELGQALGFPTANLSTLNESIPPDGVYSVMVMFEGRLVKGACNIGMNPTFAGTTRTIEVFLLDFSGQIYGRDIAVYFVQRLRDVKKFANAAELSSAISSDVERTRTILDAVQEELIKPREVIGTT